ncbi:hypothetical protein BD413DRAFT_305541 [Trametes elegans]|nr:hypothetical protein BD413DRAFT_305541 [Trametes elegans]
MRFTLSIIGSILFSLAIEAAPTSPVSRNITLGATFPHATFNATHSMRIGITAGAPPTGGSTLPHGSSGGGPHTPPANMWPATLLLCATTDCANCDGWDMASVPVNECFSAGYQYYSVAIDQPSNGGLSFGTYVEQSGCSGYLQVQAVNTCYTIEGGTFEDYILVN